MTKNEIINVNRVGWNKLIKSKKQFANTSLPDYGPFLKRNENQINLFKNIKNAKVLDLGCGSGQSLGYLYRRGAKEIWGLDISEEQIFNAKKIFPQFGNNFYVAPMENYIGIENYFDYVISIFSIGYTSDLLKTFENVYKYLNISGEFIISWTHPFYFCLDIKGNDVILKKSYFKEGEEIITKGPDKVELVQKNVMISTMINTALKSNFYLDTMLEEETVLKDDVNGYKSNFWKKEKTQNCPSTIIFKFKKLR